MRVSMFFFAVGDHPIENFLRFAVDGFIKP